MYIVRLKLFFSLGLRHLGAKKTGFYFIFVHLISAECEKQLFPFFAPPSPPFLIYSCLFITLSKVRLYWIPRRTAG